MWLRNHFPKLIIFNESIDLQISTDSFNGDQLSVANPINTGFYMVTSNNRTISLFEKWHAQKNYSTKLKEQDVLNGTMKEASMATNGTEENPISTSFYMVRSNSRIVSLFDKWYTWKTNPPD
ncbi:hypothetical protein GBA52_006360 [Prunus armeniaca]|nr:hypothetical protein GBA52_006360 [Prunus armeniaca]